MKDEQPLRLFRHMGVAMAVAVHQGVQEHEARLHGQPPSPAPCQDPPDADEGIPESKLPIINEAVESLRTEAFAISVAARIFGYPEPLIQSALADYRARFRNSNQSQAGA